MNEKGFTLLETILVIAVIGILSSILVPNFQKYQLKSRVVAHNSSLEVLKSSSLLFYLDHPDIEEISKDPGFLSYLEGEEDLLVDPYISKKLQCEGSFKINVEDGAIVISPGRLLIDQGELIEEVRVK